jgi:hypothetical protein
MPRSATKRAVESPISVVVPASLRARLQREAKKRGLKISPTIRALVAERVREIDDESALDRALEWQRAAAWATWESTQRGDVSDDFSELDAVFDRALRRRTKK